MAITAPVLERLHALRPRWRLTVCSALPEAALRSRIQCPFELRGDDRHDFGLRMRRDLSVDAAATVSDYTALHGTWAEQVERRAKRLLESGCDGVLANISYLNIAAAARAGIPAIALSPLNWADLFRHYAPPAPANQRLFEQMTAAYNRASVFLAPRPCMPMPHFTNVEIIPPVAQTGRDRRAALRRCLRLDASATLVLLALGGREADPDAAALPRLPGVHWLMDGRRPHRADILDVAPTGLTFPDLLASCDLLVCKPGYGAFAEAACLGRPVVYIRRPDWPEEIHLIDWLAQRVRCREAPRGDARALADAVTALLDAPAAGGCRPGGVAVCCERLIEALE